MSKFRIVNIVMFISLFVGLLYAITISWDMLEIYDARDKVFVYIFYSMMMFLMWALVDIQIKEHDNE